MNIQSLKIHNFRSISKLDLSLDVESRVVCLVGENGSAKTSVLSIIAEAIVSKTKLEFPNFSPNSGNRYRFLDQTEIKEDRNFYSVELHYSNIQKHHYEFKKIVGIKQNLDASEYQDVIQGVNLSRDYYDETSSLRSLTHDKDYLFSNVFLIRPSHRYEIDGLEVSEKTGFQPSVSVKENYTGEMPYPFIVAHSGNNIQSVILDMYFDSIVGYADSREGFDAISKILQIITGKDFGNFQISPSPYRKVICSNIGDITSLSQGELDLLVTIAAIVRRQLYFYRTYSDSDKKEFGIDTFFKVPGVVLIDEVDLHLHPKAQEKYLSSLTDIFPNIQFIVTTHSPFVVRGLPKYSKVINLPSGRVFNDNFEAMDIDSITNIIFGYDGGFSESVNQKLSRFKEELVSEDPDIQVLKQLFSELATSNAAKEELSLYLASYADEGLINAVKEV